MHQDTLRRALLASATVMTFAYGAHAQTVSIPGGGAASPAQDFAGPGVVTNANPTSPSEEASFDSANSQFAFQYFNSNSGRGQAAFSTDAPAQWQYTGTTPLPATVDYGVSDAFLSGTSGQTINGFTYTTVAGISGLTATYPLRTTQDGALIQLPMLGVGLTIPAASGNPAVKANGKLHLTDGDICGIFSGQITSYSSISHPLAGLTGQIRVYFRTDSAGASFLLTNHLKAVCTAANSNFPNLAAAPTSTFATLFNGTPPGNFTGESGNAALATALAGTVTTAGGHTVGPAGDPTGIGYISTDFTDISTNGKANDTTAPNPPGGFINTAALFVAGLEGKNETAFTTPTVASINSGLAHAGAGSFQGKPPTGQLVKNPLHWIPSIPLVTVGYPIVGFTTWELAQCYANANVASGLSAFLSGHFGGSFNSVINANGFTLPSKAYITAIKAAFLTPSSSLAIAAAGTAGTCLHATGR